MCQRVLNSASYSGSTIRENIMRKFKNPSGTVMLMQLKGMYQVHSDNLRSITILKTTDEYKAVAHYQEMVWELEASNDSRITGMSSP